MTWFVGHASCSSRSTSFGPGCLAKYIHFILMRSKEAIAIFSVCGRRYPGVLTLLCRSDVTHVHPPFVGIVCRLQFPAAKCISLIILIVSDIVIRYPLDSSEMMTLVIRSTIRNCRCSCHIKCMPDDIT